ncbi:MAG TPA: purine-nucleoside phosphorylase [Gemmatimonadaceae bacterium]|nr:purine-nucleoside phosphorylase [Gemmatimonadaceae bacterium]
MTVQPQYGREAASIAADVIRSKAGGEPPVLGITLGSGLGGLAGDIKEAVVIPFAEIPGFPTATVIGHAGSVVVGGLADKRVVALAGRFHMYEGHSPQLAAFPVRVMHALGARTYFASNAAGGIRKDLTAGDLMIIEDHLNLTGVNPLTGPVEINDDRFPDMTAPYDDELRDLLKACAKRIGLPVKEGIYAWLPGPSFETKAEVRMLAGLGADAVGMSTVPEVIVARAMGMRVAGMSCIANAASGIGVTPVLHSDVLDVTAKAAVGFQALVREFVAGLPSTK